MNVEKVNNIENIKKHQNIESIDNVGNVKKLQKAEVKSSIEQKYGTMNIVDQHEVILGTKFLEGL